jgi:hypothetical protein
MPQTKTISRSVFILASQSDVFDAVTNWETQKKWIPFTKVVWVGTDSHKLGGKLEAYTGIGRVGFMDTMTITKWEPPFVCEVTHTGNFVKGSGLFEVSQDIDGSKFTWTEYFNLPSGILGNLAWAIVWIPTKVGLIISMRKFSKNFKK